MDDGRCYDFGPWFAFCLLPSAFHRPSSIVGVAHNLLSLAPF
jgi:hypothetical protein